ncbi:hypothetical protein JXB01_04295 [Candidatus Micrarchaeota archaeon]|nr:hypothetical protein [Candidatus Micrarchaeota archaeon]
MAAKQKEKKKESPVPKKIVTVDGFFDSVKKKKVLTEEQVKKAYLEVKKQVGMTKKEVLKVRTLQLQKLLDEKMDSAVRKEYDKILSLYVNALAGGKPAFTQAAGTKTPIEKMDPAGTAAGETEVIKVLDLMPPMNEIPKMFRKEGGVDISGPIPDSFNKNLSTLNETERENYTKGLIKVMHDIDLTKDEKNAINKGMNDYLSTQINALEKGGQTEDAEKLKSVLKEIKKGNYKKAMDKLKELGYKSITDHVFSEEGSKTTYTAFTGKEFVFFDGEFEYYIPIAKTENLYKIVKGKPEDVSVALGIVVSAFLTARGVEAYVKEGIESEAAKEILIELMAGGKGAFNVRVFKEETEVANIKIGVKGTYLAFEEIKTGWDVSAFASAFGRIPIWDFSTGKMYIYGGVEYSQPIWTQLTEDYLVGGKAGINVRWNDFQVYGGGIAKYQPSTGAGSGGELGVAYTLQSIKTIIGAGVGIIADKMGTEWRFTIKIGGTF